MSMHVDLSQAILSRRQEDIEEMAETWERVIRMLILTRTVRAYTIGAPPRLWEYSKYTLLPADPMPPVVPTYLS